MKKRKKLFIEELEVRQSSSPLFISPIERLPIERIPIPTWSGSEGGELYPSKPIGEGGLITTQAIGEEGGHVTTFALGEEGGSGIFK